MMVVCPHVHHQWIRNIPCMTASISCSRRSSLPYQSWLLLLLHRHIRRRMIIIIGRTVRGWWMRKATTRLIAISIAIAIAHDTGSPDTTTMSIIFMSLSPSPSPSQSPSQRQCLCQSLFACESQFRREAIQRRESVRGHIFVFDGTRHIPSPPTFLLPIV